jgi:hypothetical protein
MAKGGEIKYSTYENKSMEYIEGEIAHTERSARQFQQMGDYESMEDRKEHVRKLREIYNRKRAESKMAKGGELNDATYVSKRNINKVDLTINNTQKTIDGKNLIDGVYVKKTALKTPRVKFDAYKFQEELSNMAYDVWDDLNIESGSQIYASKTLQEKLAKAFLAKGIDAKYLALTPKQRKEVSEALTDENQHSLRNYIALRGYNGDDEYSSYKRMFDNSDKKNPYSLNPNAIERKSSTFAQGGEMDEDEGVDLFEDYDDQPAEVSAILEKYDLDDANYETLKELNDELKSVGYTFEYGLDGYAYDLRKIGQKGKSEFYEKGGEVFYKESHKLGM